MTGDWVDERLLHFWSVAHHIQQGPDARPAGGAAAQTATSIGAFVPDRMERIR